MNTPPTNIQIDHVVIAGKNLDEIRAGFVSVGLTPDEGGQHADGQTHNALIGFEDGSYLELIAPVPGGTAPGHVWSEYMNNDAGVCAWAIRSDDIQADVAMFRQRGIMVGDPVHGGRNRPDGVRLEWITAKLGDGPLGSVLPFLIQDMTPREWRVPRTKSAEGLITGIAEIEIALKNDDHESKLSMIEQAFGWSEPQVIANVPPIYFHYKDTPVSISAVRMGMLDWRLESFGEGIYKTYLKTPSLKTLDEKLHHSLLVNDPLEWHGSYVAHFERGTAFISEKA